MKLRSRVLAPFSRAMAAIKVSMVVRSILLARLARKDRSRFAVDFKTSELDHTSLRQILLSRP